MCSVLLPPLQHRSGVRRVRGGVGGVFHWQLCFGERRYLHLPNRDGGLVPPEDDALRAGSGAESSVASEGRTRGWFSDSESHDVRALRLLQANPVSFDLVCPQHPTKMKKISGSFPVERMFSCLRVRPPFPSPSNGMTC